MLPWKWQSFIYSDELRVLSCCIVHVLSVWFTNQIVWSCCLVMNCCVELQIKKGPLPVFGKVRPPWSNPA